MRAVLPTAAALEFGEFGGEELTEPGQGVGSASGAGCSPESCGVCVDDRVGSADVVVGRVAVLVGVSLVPAGTSVSSAGSGADVGSVSCGVEGAGVVLLGDGDGGVLSRDVEASVSELIVVVPDDEEPPTRADTGC
jgi:hypothetical protein